MKLISSQTCPSGLYARNAPGTVNNCSYIKVYLCTVHVVTIVTKNWTNLVQFITTMIIDQQYSIQCLLLSNDKIIHRRSAHSQLEGLPQFFLYESLDSLLLIDKILLLYNFYSSSPQFNFTGFGPSQFNFTSYPYVKNIYKYINF